jgi:hypothetical protein
VFVFLSPFLLVVHYITPFSLSSLTLVWPMPHHFCMIS